MPLAREDVLALEVVVDIADGRAIKGPDLARRRGLQPRSLEQLLQKLTRKGILVGQRGAQGGYRLAREAAQISVSDVVRAARSDPLRKPKFIRGSSAVKRLLKELDHRTFAWLGEVTIASLASHR
jgi:Rrf2 family protein